MDEDEECEESVNGGFRDNIGVESIAEVDGVDVVTGKSLSALQSFVWLLWFGIVAS